MKHNTIYIAAALVAALAIGAMAGCSGQSASSSSASASSASAASSQSASSSSASASSASASSSAAAAQSQDEIIAELKEAISKEPTYKSVTVTEVTKSTAKNSSEASTGDSSASAASSEAASSESAAADKASSGSDVLEAKTVYKFDASGDNLKTSMVGEFEGITMQYISDGDDAVCITDGPIYGGTTAQFDLTHFAGVEAYLTDSFGDLNSIISCVDTVKKEQKGDTIVYTLTLDPKKYVASDEALTILADSGETVSKATLAIGFDKEGRIVSMDEMTEFKSSISERTATLKDFDSTSVDPLPEADKTYEDMEADMAQKLDTYVEEIETTDDGEVIEEEVIEEEVVEDGEVVDNGEGVDDGEGVGNGVGEEESEDTAETE